MIDKRTTRKRYTADIGIITIRPDENTEILKRIPKTVIFDGSDEMRYRIGTIACTDGSKISVAVARCLEPGNIEAQKVAANLYHDLKPEWVFVVGIAGGVPNSDFSLGDVIVSSRIYDLTLEASMPNGKREFSIKGGTLHDLSRRIVQDIPAMIINELSEWYRDIDVERPFVDVNHLDHLLYGNKKWNLKIKKSLNRHFGIERKPIVIPGPIVSSDRLMKDPFITESWIKIARHFLAIDMELSGIIRALEKVPVLGIRGISDIIGFQRDEIWTSYACKSAAMFAISLIKSGVLPLNRKTSVLKKNIDTVKKENQNLKVDLARLPIPSINKIFGRNSEIELLKSYLKNEEVPIVTIVGFAGLGKSTLIDSFLTEIAPDYSSTKKVFGWHFYSQEMQDKTIANSTQFFDEALKFYNYIGAPSIHDNEKAQILSDLIRKQKSILILDGIEPLQHTPLIKGGNLNDKAIQILLNNIARAGLPSGGLVIISSRQPVTDIERFPKTKTHLLDKLTTKSGNSLLRHLGVFGTDQEIDKAVSHYKGHSLSLVLLGKLIKNDYNGDILKASRINLLDIDDDETNITEILKYYDKNWKNDEPERIVLYLLSLFNMPMGKEELYLLFSQSKIGAPLKKIKSNRLNRILSQLESLGLIIKTISHFDTHSLIRQYFFIEFKRIKRQFFVQANKVLFDYFQNLPKKYLPDRIEDIELLYRAIYHGCLATESNSSLKIFWERICRKREFYSQKKLGSISSDLYAASRFYPDGWDQKSIKGLSEDQQAWVLSVAAFRLMALGRFEEAIHPRMVEIGIFKRIKDWALVASDSINYIDTLLYLGRIDEALEMANSTIQIVNHLQSGRSITEYSKTIDHHFIRISALSRKAELLRSKGDFVESKSLFENAEKLSTNIYGEILLRTNGYYYCILLIDIAKSKNQLSKILDRANCGLNASNAENKLHNSGNYNLVLAVVFSQLNEKEHSLKYYDQAVEMLNKSGRFDRIPNALIYQSQYFLKLWRESQTDSWLYLLEDNLEKINEYIVFSNMKICECEWLALNAQYLIVQSKYEIAYSLYNKLEKSVTSCNYLRLQPVVKEIQKNIATYNKFTLLKK